MTKDVMSVGEIATGARATLESRGWCQQDNGSHQPDGRVCLQGAINDFVYGAPDPFKVDYASVYELNYRNPAIQAIRQAAVDLGLIPEHEVLYGWNDDRDRTPEEVKGLLTRIAEHKKVSKTLVDTDPTKVKGYNGLIQP